VECSAGAVTPRLEVVRLRIRLLPDDQRLDSIEGRSTPGPGVGNGPRTARRRGTSMSGSPSLGAARL
jgi:hypothetical protein